MKLGNVARVIALAAGCLAAVGSATSSSNNPSTASTSAPPDGAGGIYGNSPPPARQMEPGRALGLWKSTFGAVKIEADQSRGGLQSGAVQGIWMYQRQGTDVVGYFSGMLNGNVLNFKWQEPGSDAAGPLIGEGFVVFETSGRQYSGRWWSTKHDRVGDWNGWRQGGGAEQAPPPRQYGELGQNPYGQQPQQGNPYPEPQQYPAQPQQYPPAQQPYGGQPQPYPAQQAPSPYGQQQPQSYPPQQQQPYPAQQAPAQPRPTGTYY